MIVKSQYGCGVRDEKLVSLTDNALYYLLLRLVLTSVKKKAIGLSRLEVKRNFIVGRKNRFKAFLSQVISDILSAADSDFNGRFG